MPEYILPPLPEVQAASGVANTWACAASIPPSKTIPAVKAAAATQTAAFPPDCLPEDLVHSLTATRFPVRLQKITLYILFIHHPCDHATFTRTFATFVPPEKLKIIHHASLMRLRNRLKPFKPVFPQQKTPFQTERHARQAISMRSIRSRKSQREATMRPFSHK